MLGCDLPPDNPPAGSVSSGAPQKPESKEHPSKVTKPPEPENEDRHKLEEPKSCDCHSQLLEELRMYHPTKHSCYNES